MAQNTVKLITQVNGSVEAIRNVLGVVTDNYNDLVNKPTVNGVKLQGNVNLETLKAIEPAGPSVYVYPNSVGNAQTLVAEELGLFTAGRNFQLGDIILTQDKKLFYVNGFDIPEHNQGEAAGIIHIGTLFWDLA